MKKICLTAMLLISVSLFAQTPRKGYIIEMEGSNVFVDFTSKDVKVGDRLKVISDSKEIIHPVTKEKIIKDGELIATLEITETHSNYSVASRVYPANAFPKLIVGAKVYLPSDSSTSIAILPKDGKVNVSIAPAAINDLVGPGFFGTYVSDMLMSELISCEKIRLIDRTVLNDQVGETNLKEAGLLNAENAIQRGRIAGVQYIIQVTMQKPDVTDLSTNAPIKSIATAAAAVAGIAGAPSSVTNGLSIGSNITSNVRTSHLKANVSLTARVVDVQTGEILFMCSGDGTAQGENQVEMEGGALGGMQINGGVDGFRQTVTGKAVALGFRKIGSALIDYFEGKTTEKNVNKSAFGSALTYRNGNIYQGVYKLSKNEIQTQFSENQDLYFRVTKGFKLKKMGIWFIPLGIASVAGVTLMMEAPVEYVVTTSLLSVIPGLIISNNGKRKIKEVVGLYNNRLRNNAQYSEISIGLKQNGITLTVGL